MWTHIHADRAAGPVAVTRTVAVMGFVLTLVVLPATGQIPDHRGSGMKSVRARLGLRGGTLEHITLSGTAGSGTSDGHISFGVDLGGAWHVARLRPYSLRAPGFRVRVDVGGGVLEDAAVAPPQTYRGELDDGSGTVRASLGYNGLSAVVFMDGAEWYIEPVASAGAAGGHADYVVYAHTDVAARGGVCGTDAAPVQVSPSGAVRAGASPHASGGGVRIAEIAFDTDYEYFTALGSSVTGVVNDIERIMNAVEEMYDLQFGVQYEITEIIVRSDPSDPYTTSDAAALLQQFQTTWISPPQSDIPRDLAHLFTGRSLQNDVIGFATLGQVCHVGQAFGLSRSRFSSNLARRVDLTTHEIGHNWNAPHCNTPSAPGLPFPGCCDAPTYTMCEFIGFAVRNHFCPPVIDFVSQFIDTRDCLDVPAATLALPFADDFSGEQIDPAIWINEDATLDTGGAGEPSPPTSLRLNGVDRITSQFADTTSACGVTLEYWWQRTGTLGAGGSPEPGEDLLVEYRAASGLWETAARHPGDGPDDDPYQFNQVILPDDAEHNAFQVRFSLTGNPSLSDNYFVDDVNVFAQTQGVQVVAQPADVSVCPGGEAMFNVAVAGDPPITYQWKKNGVALPGETGDTLVIGPVDDGDVGVYSVEIGNPCNTIQSDEAELLEVPPIVIVTQPLGDTLVPGESFFSFLVAGGSPTFQWFKDGVALPGETQFFLRIADVGCDDAGFYHCELQNACSTVSSDVVELVIDADCVDKTPPRIVHGDGLAGSTRPHSGYIDPRMESTDGLAHDLGITQVAIRFSEPVEDVGPAGGGLTAAAFSVVQTGGGVPPQVVAVDASNMPLVVLTLSRPPSLNEWTTIQAHVQDLAPTPNVIEPQQDQGPGVDETDRVDIAALPCDVDQDGRVAPIDLLRLRQIISGVFTPSQGQAEDYVDMDRDGSVRPIDLLRFRQLFSGTAPATRAWGGETLLNNRP